MATWLDKVTDKLIITTGDGENYYPQWINASKSKEYNVSEFNFVELAGSLVDRREAKGNRYTLEIHFQGKDHLDIAAKFDKSSDFKKYWSISHPYYGFINVQPLSISQDNSVYNISKFTIPLIETITDDAPKASIDAVGSIKIYKIILDEQLAEISAKIKPNDINVLKDVNKKCYNLSVPIISVPDEFQTILNIFNAANSAVDTAIASPLLAMRASISLLSAPANLTASVSSRVGVLLNAFNTLSDKALGMVEVSSKQLYQSQGGALLSAMCLSAVTPLNGDFSNSSKVTSIINSIVNSYNTYFSKIGVLQSSNGNSPFSFIPNFQQLVGVTNLVNDTISYLYTQALTSKKEKSIICEHDTNIIILCHRFYGLDLLDQNLKEFIENNNFSVDEYVIVQKGRKIIYYI